MFSYSSGYPQLREGFGYPYLPDFTGTRHQRCSTRVQDLDSSPVFWDLDLDLRPVDSDLDLDLRPVDLDLDLDLPPPDLRHGLDTSGLEPDFTLA